MGKMAKVRMVMVKDRTATARVKTTSTANLKSFLPDQRSLVLRWFFV
jgi:hypothetical protein